MVHVFRYSPVLWMNHSTYIICSINLHLLLFGDEITFAYYTKVILGLCLSQDAWMKIDSKIQCLLWSPNVMNPKYPHIFPDTLSLSYPGPASRPCELGFMLPNPFACLLQTTTSYHRTPAAQPGPQARPLVYPTLMALFSNSEPFAILPSTLQESNLTWRPIAHSHRFHNINRSNHTSICLHHILFIH